MNRTRSFQKLGLKTTICIMAILWMGCDPLVFSGIKNDSADTCFVRLAPDYFNPQFTEDTVSIRGTTCRTILPYGFFEICSDIGYHGSCANGITELVIFTPFDTLNLKGDLIAKDLFRYKSGRREITISEDGKILR